MFPRAPEFETQSSTESGSEGASGSPGPDLHFGASPFPDGRALKLPLWIEATAYFLSAAFYISVVLAILSPLPLLVYGWIRGRFRGFLAVAVNVAGVAAVAHFTHAGWDTLAIYLVIAVAPALALLEAFRFRFRPGMAALMAFGGMVLMLGCVEYAAALRSGRSVGAEVRSQVQEVRLSLQEADRMVLSQIEKQGAQTQAEVQARLEAVAQELPAGMVLLCEFLIFVNMVSLLRLNPLRLREWLGLNPGYFRNWKSSQAWMVPTLLAGAVYAFGKGKIEVFGWNALQVCLFVYLVHGLSVLVFVLDLWRIRGFPRTAAFLTALWLMFPLLLAVGYFDLWFDFRAKLRQA